MAGKAYDAVEFITVGNATYQVFYAKSGDGTSRDHVCPTCHAPGTYIGQDYEIVEMRNARFQQRQVRRDGKLWEEITKLFLSSPRRVDDCFICDFCLEESMAEVEAPGIVHDAIDLSIPIDTSEM